jgi:hypothetical protein
MTYQEILALATEGLPTNIDYSKYLQDTNKFSFYGKSEIASWKRIAKTVAKNLSIK